MTTKMRIKINEQGVSPRGEDYIIIERREYASPFLYNVDFIAYVGRVNATFRDLARAKEFVANYEEEHR